MGMKEITIVGAGLSGITAARYLKENGVEDVLLVDKGRSVGGRLATRRMADGKADHGAQFFTVRTNELEHEVQDWLGNEWIRKWYGNDYPRYTAVNGMNGLAKKLAEGLTVSLDTKVIKIKKEESGYRLFDEKGRSWQSKKVILTVPVPQTVQLLKESEVSVGDAVMKQLKRIAFLPTYVGLFHFQSPTSLPEDGQIDHDLPDGVERLVDHKKKGISEDTIVSVYMTGDWSRRHFGDDYVMSLIKEKTEDFFDWSNLESEQLKKWRYAQAKETYPASYLDLLGDGTLLSAGDAFLRPDDEAGRTRFESAYLSGKDVSLFLTGNSFD
ncbi:FAD-binding protein [Halobacillus fulvus]|nr:FAD-binding protein [Halobacillus fulvus]